MQDLVAVIDVGKTHAKLHLVSRARRRTVWSVERPSPAVPSRVGCLGRELDVDGIGGWLLAQFAACPERAEIGAVVPVAHGAAMVLVDAAGRVLAAPDYEDPQFDLHRVGYAMRRDPFAATLSPGLPLGLNLGRQLFHLAREAPDLLARTRHVLTYPQYWSWWLSGVAASEATSLGCHSDLWRPGAADWSALARDEGWAALMPPRHSARAVLGHVLPWVVQATGLGAAVDVVCGIHDSNASYLSHRVGRPEDATFGVVSSGTWCIVLAHGSRPVLDEAADMLANVDALGVATPTARFMGGREYAAIAGTDAPPTLAGLARVLDTGAMALPSFALAGPFQGQPGCLVGADALGAEDRASLATLYCALMADLLLDRLEMAGPVLVDGPLAGNPLFAPVLAALRPSHPVTPSGGRAGITPAILWLAGETVAPEPDPPASPPLPMAVGVRAYRDAWRRRVNS